MKKITSKKPILILVCGSSGSGKTTFSEMIVERLKTQNLKACIICQDSYYKDVDDSLVDTFNYDDIEAFDWNMLISDISRLVKGQEVYIPEYDYKIHKKILNKHLIKDCDFIILEGLHTLSRKKLKHIAKISLFIDTPKDECLARRIVRDVKQRGRTIESIINQWQNCVSLMYDKYVAPLKNEASLVIPWSKKNETLVDFLIPSLITALSTIK